MTNLNFSSLRKINIQFGEFSSFEQISELDDCLLMFDDSCEEISNDKEFSKLATAGRHKKISDLREAQLVSTVQMVQND